MEQPVISVWQLIMEAIGPIAVFVIGILVFIALVCYGITMLRGMFKI